MIGAGIFNRCSFCHLQSLLYLTAPPATGQILYCVLAFVELFGLETHSLALRCAPSTHLPRGCSATHHQFSLMHLLVSLQNLGPASLFAQQGAKKQGQVGCAGFLGAGGVQYCLRLQPHLLWQLINDVSIMEKVLGIGMEDGRPHSGKVGEGGA